VATPSRKKPPKPPAPEPAANPPPLPQTVCRRCGTPGPVGDDGFCDKCEKTLEQACL